MTHPAGRPIRPPINLAAEWLHWWQLTASALQDEAGGALAAAQGFVLTAEQMRDVLGWTDNDLRRERRRGRWWSPARGTASPVVIDGDGPTEQRRRHALVAVATALTHPGQKVSGRSAAILTGLPTMRVPEQPELTAVGPATYGRHGTARSFRAGIASTDVTRWFGVGVATVARTVVDLARHDRFDGIMAADAALRDGLATPDDFRGPLRTAVGWPGVRQARSVVEVASPLAESPLESVTRLRLTDDGFPDVREQQPFPDPRTGRIDWVDFLIGRRLVLEADGAEKYVADALWREKQREARLRRHPILLDRVIWEDVTRYWPRTSDRLWRQLRGW
jgi:hypothetical protein